MRGHRRRRRDDSHMDDWLMTYADMITLLLCFFAVFLSVSMPRKDKFEQVRQEVKEHFASKDVLEGKFPFRNEPVKIEPSAKDPYDALPSIVDHFAEKLNENEGVKVEEGDRITTIEMNSAPFFPVGSATLNPEGAKVLGELLETIKGDKFKDYQITVEGHTDDSPIKTAQFPSNWELSTSRATAVVRFLLEQGVPAQKLRASGYADAFPKVPNRDAAGKPIPDNQAQNRRVVIRLEKVVKAPEAAPAQQ